MLDNFSQNFEREKRFHDVYIRLYICRKSTSISIPIILTVSVTIRLKSFVYYSKGFEVPSSEVPSRYPLLLIVTSMDVIESIAYHFKPIVTPSTIGLRYLFSIRS